VYRTTPFAPGSANAPAQLRGNVVPTVSSSLIDLGCSGASPYHFDAEDDYELRFIAAKGLRAISAMPTLKSKDG